MNQRLILKDRVAIILLAMLDTNSVQAQQILTYFAPYCDCDVREWIVARINAGDNSVINKIKAILAVEDDDPIYRTPHFPKAGQLTHTYCQGRDMYGVYADGGGNSTHKLVQQFAALCGGPLKARFYFPLESEREKVLSYQLATFSAYHMSEPNEVDTEPYLTSYKYYDPVPVPEIRFQFKIGGMLEEDYAGISVRLISSNNGIDSVPDINNDTPYDAHPNSEYVTLTYEPSTRIVTIEIPYVWQASISCFIAVIKDNKIIGWLKLETNIFFKDQAGLIWDFKTWIINPGSDNYS